jgi:hypothetical protein
MASKIVFQLDPNNPGEHLVPDLRSEAANVPCPKATPLGAGATPLDTATEPHDVT